MNPPNTVKWRDLKRVLGSYGLTISEGKSAGHRRKRHAIISDAHGNKFPIPAHNEGDDVYRTYVEAARRKFGLAPANGISNDAFYGRI